MTAVLRLSGVGKHYRDRAVLSGVDLEVLPGEAVAVAGGNGSGKSTLLRLIARLSRPSSGTIDGTSSVGYVPDRFPAATRMSALAYLRHLGRISEVPDVDDKSTKLLTRLALSGGPRAPIRQLSKGNAQKVALAQALLTDPELLVLDEPWSGLDPAAYEVLGELIAETRARGGGVVFTVHEESAAEPHADRVFVLDAGKLRAAGERASARIVLTRAGERVERAVAADEVDAVLLESLRAGWSVLEVSR